MNIKNNTSVLILGATGFIGTNLLIFFQKKNYQVTAVYNKRKPRIFHKNINWIKCDLRKSNLIKKKLFFKDYDLVIQAAATTSGSKDIINTPSLHVTDNAVMNSYLLKHFSESLSKHFIFFSCTVMLQSSSKQIIEKDFDASKDPVDKYFGVGWTKVYVEKMLNFYSKLNPSKKYTVIRHSNIFGEFDKFDLNKGHVLASAIVKIFNSNSDQIEMWGDGKEGRDFLYIKDLINFVFLCYKRQRNNFSIFNCGSGKIISIMNVYKSIMLITGKTLKIKKNLDKPSIKFNVKLNTKKAKTILGWENKTSFNDGLKKTINWYKANFKIE